MSDCWKCPSCRELLFSMSVVDPSDIHRHQNFCGKFDELFAMMKQGKKSGKVKLDENSSISFKYEVDMTTLERRG